MKNYLISFLLFAFFIEGKILANTIVVSSIPELQLAINDAKPGDIIILKNGVYNSISNIVVAVAGTKSKPITISAESAAGAEISGSGGFNIVSPAAYIIIRDFKFTHNASKARCATGTGPTCPWRP